MPASLYLDECVSVHVAGQLQTLGYDVVTARNAGNAGRGCSDEEQLEYASAQGRVLITHDIQDYVALAREWHRSGRSHKGIIYVPPGLSAGETAARIHTLLDRYVQQLDDCFLVA